MAGLEGLEPPTTWFEARYSIRLSYRPAQGVFVPQNGSLVEFFVQFLAQYAVYFAGVGFAAGFLHHLAD